MSHLDTADKATPNRHHKELRPACAGNARFAGDDRPQILRRKLPPPPAFTLPDLRDGSPVATLLRQSGPVTGIVILRRCALAKVLGTAARCARF